MVRLGPFVGRIASLALAMTDENLTIPSTPTHLKQAQLRDFHRHLHAWYASHGRRDLPWRNTHDPYAIYLSEVMLQQTQVKTVLERYYGPFLKRFPTLDVLAQAPRDALMKAWEGLGYYSRANNLQKAAQASGGTLPDTFDGLIALPGIGVNTAHAVLAFAFRKPVAVMETNVKRVLCRIFALASPSDKELWALAQAMVDREEPFDYNQAMMDIGAMVCTKTSPLCTACPANRICKGKDAPGLYPAPKASKKVPVRKRFIVAWRDAKGRYHLTQRDSRFLHGLYGFDEYEAQPEGEIHWLGEVTQTYSHFQLQAKVGVAEAPPHLRWNAGAYYGLAGIAALPLSRADAKALALIEAYERRSDDRRKK